MRSRLITMVTVALIAGQVAVPHARAAYPGTDGRIAYNLGESLVTINPDGTGKRVIVPGTDTGSIEASWSPDGTQLAATAWVFNGPSGIEIVSSDGVHHSLVITSPGNGVPTWSPDGQRIAFLHQGTLHVVNVDGTNETEIVPIKGDPDTPTWSPDGQWIAFRGFNNKGTFIYKVHPDGTGMVKLTRTTGRFVAEPDWSPDGTQIVYASDQAAPHSPTDIWLMNADGRNQHALTVANLETEKRPSFSPDGQTVVFERDGPASGLFIVGVDGSNEHLLPNSAAKGRDPSWQPILAPAGTLTADPNPLPGFGFKRVGGSSKHESVKLTNTTAATMTLNGFSFEGSDAADFTVANTTCPATLAAGASCKVAVAFGPTATGARLAELHVSVDAESEPRYLTPVSGIGITHAPTAASLHR